MKMGQLASFIDTDYLPDEYRELYQEKLGALRTSAPAMPWEKVRKVLDARVRRALRGAVRSGSSRRRSRRHRSARCTAAVLHDGREVAVKIQYPGIDAAIRADLSNAGMILRLAKALAPGLDAKAVAAELRERVLEELDYEHEAQNQRSFARAYRDHPFIYVPDVVTRLSRSRVLVTEYVEGIELRAGEAARPGGAQPLRARSSSASTSARSTSSTTSTRTRTRATTCCSHDGQVAFLDFGMTKRLDPEQIRLEEEVVQGAARPRPRAPAREAARARLPAQPAAHRRGAPDGARRRGRGLVLPATRSARSRPST